MLQAASSLQSERPLSSIPTALHIKKTGYVLALQYISYHTTDNSEAVLAGINSPLPSSRMIKVFCTGLQKYSPPLGQMMQWCESMCKRKAACTYTIQIRSLVYSIFILWNVVWALFCKFIKVFDTVFFPTFFGKGAVIFLTLIVPGIVQCPRWGNTSI